jgi:sporulation protein YlmC with PRC-barrel domain
MKVVHGMCAVVTAVSLVLFTASLGLAEPQVDVKVGRDGVKVNTQAAKDARGSFAYRSSTLVGMAVKNSAGEDLGKINDLVIDERGSVRYAAISFGGFLGVGDKLFAVPYRSLTIRTDVDGKHHAELNVNKKLLEKAPGFPSDKWPDFGDESFTKEIDSFYPHAAGAAVDRDRGIVK